MLNKILNSLIAKYRLTLRKIILYVFYSSVQDKTKYLSAPMFYIFFVQKILGLNRRVPFPVHPANHIGTLTKIFLAESVRYSLAVNGGIHIQGINGVEIGADTIIAAGVKIYSANHDKVDFNKHISSNPIKIGNHCWLGANCTILPGVILGDNVIVAAGAVVTKSFPNNSVVGGVPAKIISSS